MGIIEWQSYPHLTMEFVQRLPFPRLDMTDAGDRLLHDEIAAETRVLSRTPDATASESNDSILETLVRRAFGISADESEHIDQSLEYIQRFGPLLGEVDEVDEGDETF